MKNLVLCFALLGFSSSSVHAEDNLGLHFGFSTGLGFVAENILHSKVDSNSKRIVYATLLGSVPGLFKELSDNEFSGEDMAADVLGSFVGSFLANHLNKKTTATIQKKHDSYFVGIIYRD
jgi:VanZ family protein